MKLSKELWVDEGVKWNVYIRMQLKRFNTYKGKGYLICTSPQKQWLFEIIQGKHLTNAYSECYVVAVVLNKQQAYSCLTRIIDAIYNTQSKTYIDFKS